MPAWDIKGTLVILVEMEQYDWSKRISTVAVVFNFERVDKIALRLCVTTHFSI